MLYIASHFTVRGVKARDRSLPRSKTRRLANNHGYPVLQLPAAAIKALNLLCGDYVLVDVVDNGGFLDKEIRLRKVIPDPKALVVAE